VVRVSADASERSAAEPGRGTLAYRALIAPAAQQLRSDGREYDLLAGMQLTAEIRLADRTVLEYLLSPVQKIAAEAGRER
jgi:HlyD family secretion protein